MPNINDPAGFKPVKMVGGAAFIGSPTAYKIASGTAATIAAGDVVGLAATGYIAAITTGQMRGVVAGVEYVGSDGIPVRRPNWVSGTTTLGGQEATIYVYDDPNIIFEARFGNSANVVPQSSVGNTFPSFGNSTPDAIGNSQAGVDATTLTTTTNAHWRFLGHSPKPDNDTASAYALGLFCPISHDFRQSTGI